MKISTLVRGFRQERPEAVLASLGLAPEDVVALHEITELLGVSKRTAATYANRDDFPPPAVYLSTGRVWRRKDVEAWARRTLPLRTGRPPKEGA
jgi:prophage regulatory protein